MRDSGIQNVRFRDSLHRPSYAVGRSDRRVQSVEVAPVPDTVSLSSRFCIGSNFMREIPSSMGLTNELLARITASPVGRIERVRGLGYVGGSTLQPALLTV